MQLWFLGIIFPGETADLNKQLHGSCPGKRWKQKGTSNIELTTRTFISFSGVWEGEWMGRQQLAEGEDQKELGGPERNVAL